MSEPLRRASLPAALACLALGFVLGGLSWVGLGLCAAAMAAYVWPGSLSHLPSTLPPTMLLLTAMLGMLFGISTLPMLLTVICGLAWWDLDAFQRRTRAFQETVEYAQLESTHLRRLGGVLLVGLALGAAALWVEINLTLGWAVGLGLILVLGLRFLLKLNLDG